MNFKKSGKIITVMIATAALITSLAKDNKKERNK